jgi:phytoene dehydrogenase-like protein
MDTSFDVVVAGAGLAGLTAGATAAQAGKRVVVVDGHPAGGRARTDERRGFLFNQGAHALYVGGHANRVLDQLGIGMPPGGRPYRFQWGQAGELVSPLPFSARGAARSRLLDTVGKAQLARMILQLRSLDTSTLYDRSAEAWLVGLDLRPEPTEILRTLARVASYADDLEAISADAVAGQIQLAATKGVRYLDGGWQSLVDALTRAATAAGVVVRIGSPVAAVEPADGQGLVVRLGDGPELHAAAAVLAPGGPAAVASTLQAPPHWGLVGPPAAVACLDLGLRKAPRRKVLFGVGEPLYLSTHTPAAALAPAGMAVVHLMRYGARDPERDRAQLWELARTAGIEDDDVVEHRFLARMVVTHAVPVPGSGLAGRPRVDSAGVPGVFVAGDWVGPDGLLADAALASGADAGARAAAAVAVGRGRLPAA